MSGNAALAKKLLDRFVEALPQHQNELRQAIQENNRTALEEIAHSLRGVCGFSSLPKLEHALAKLEYLAQHTQTDNILLEALNDVMQQIDAVIGAHQTLASIIEECNIT